MTKQPVLLQADRHQPDPAAPPPVLSDERICLRPWRADDAPALVAAWHDPEIVAWQPVPDRHDLAAAQRWIEGWDLRWRTRTALDLVICDIADFPAVPLAPGTGSLDSGVHGEVGLSGIDATRRAALVGWWLADSSRGQGRAARAVNLLARWAFGVGGLDVLVAEIEAGNDRSQALASRCGFARVANRQTYVLRAPTFGEPAKNPTNNP